LNGQYVIWVNICSFNCTDIVLRTRHYEQVFFKEYIRIENVGFRNIRNFKVEHACYGTCFCEMLWNFETCNMIVFMFADEQERVQKKTFVNWINSYLSKVSNLANIGIVMQV
jgi:hypothetical protein